MSKVVQQQTEHKVQQIAFHEKETPFVEDYDSSVVPTETEKTDKEESDSDQPQVDMIRIHQGPVGASLVPQLSVSEIKTEKQAEELSKEELEKQKRFKQASVDADLRKVGALVDKIAFVNDQHPLYDEKKRKSIIDEYKKYSSRVNEIGDKILKKSNIAGKRGLKRKEEIGLREELIRTKSDAMKEYIKLTSKDKETLARELVNEDYRMWVRLRNMYEAHGDYSGVKSAQKEIDKLESKLKGKDVSYDVNIQVEKEVDEKQEKLNRRIDERIRERKLSSRSMRDRIEMEIRKDQGIGEHEKLEKYQQELIDMLVKERIEELREKEMAPEYKVDKVQEAIDEVKKIPWVKGFSSDEQIWVALYGKVSYSYRKDWIEKHPFFKEPTKDQIHTILQTIVAVWEDNHEVDKLTPFQKDLLKKERIPQFKDAKSESMRLIVNGLHDSLYIFETHKQRDAFKIEQPVTIPAKKAGDKGALQGYEYEKQDRGNDCWSVALASLVNFNLPEEGKKITQTTVRTQTPVFRAQAPGEETEDYDRAKSGIEWFTTKNQGAVSHMGNIFAMSDFISGQVKDTAIRHMVFSTPKCRLDDERNPGKNAVYNVTQVLKSTIQKALSSGQPIAVLMDSHYRVIVSADDSGVKMLNSAGDKAHLDENVKYDDLMKSGGQLELTWLQKDVASLADEFSGLEKKDEKLTAKEKDAVLDPDLVAITSGVVVHKKDTDIPNDVSEYISERVYIPKGLMAEPEVKTEKDAKTD